VCTSGPEFNFGIVLRAALNDIIEQMQSFSGHKPRDIDELSSSSKGLVLLDVEHRELWKYSDNVSGIIEHYTCCEHEWKERLEDYSKLNSFVRVMRSVASASFEQTRLEGRRKLNYCHQASLIKFYA
jgi:hypothetical protein